MLRPVRKEDDWNRVAAYCAARAQHLEMPNQVDLVRVSKLLDRNPKKEGVSDATWRNLFNGVPLTRADKIQLICRTMQWSSDSIDLILRGEEPIDQSERGGVERVMTAAHLDDHEERLTRLETQMQEMGRGLESLERRVPRDENKSEET